MIRSFIARRRGRPVRQTAASLTRFSLSTYYDSQSGLHVPIHNEKEIKLFLNKSKEDTSTTGSFVPAQLYKEDASSDMPQRLKSLRAEGIHGVILPSAKFPRDVRNLQTLSHIAPEEFVFFTPYHSQVKSFSSVSTMLALEDNEDMKNTLKPLVAAGSKTTLLLHEAFYRNQELMHVAGQVARLIDETGGGDTFLITASDKIDADDVIQLCEELMYLDVAGPTIKSRIILNSTNEELIDELMLLGVSKFALDEEEDISMLEDISKWQGKSLLK
uniref:Uncharacterized protein n=1 Tax=Ditylum brightwellii TaxID=49249 RepID=A0A7S2EM21_9STRA